MPSKQIKALKILLSMPKETNTAADGMIDWEIGRSLTVRSVRQFVSAESSHQNDAASRRSIQCNVRVEVELSTGTMVARR